MNSLAVQPYSGVRIIDLTQELGAYATRLFADLGAEVIRVEPLEGRADRSAGLSQQNSSGQDGSAAFTFFGVNKKSVALDLRTSAGRGVLGELIATAQVVAYESCPELDLLELVSTVPGQRVVAVLSHFGLTGPYASYLGCDLVDQALGGIAWLSGKIDNAPLRIGGGQAGFVTSIYAAIATAAALWELEKSGTGHLLDISAQEAIAHSLQNTIQMYDIAGKVTLRGGVARDVMEGIFACSDGYVFLAAPPFMGDQWNQIITWMDETGFAQHARLREPEWSQRDLRTSSDLRAEFKQLFEQFLADKKRAAIANECIARKILIAPVSTVADLPDDRQLSYRNFFTSITHGGDTIAFPGAPYRMSEEVWQLKDGPPRLGADNDRYLASLATASSKPARVERA